MSSYIQRICIFLLAIPALTSCAGSPDCFHENVFCAALVTDTLGINDHGINQDAWAGLQQAKLDGLVEDIAIIESIDSRDYEKNIAYFAQNGYDAIITTGMGMRDETLRAADQFPASTFIGMNQPQEQTRPNLISVSFLEDQMGFFAGALAAQLTKTGIIGAVCETSGLDSMYRYCEGFRAGVLYTKEEMIILVEYHDGGSRDKLFADEVWGYETARGEIKRGADVIFAAGGGTGQGALKGASEAGIHAIGAERDQAAALGIEGSSVVTSVYGRASFEVQAVMRLLRDRNVIKKRIGQIGYVPFAREFPQYLVPEMDALLLNLSDGTIKIDVAFEKP